MDEPKSSRERITKAARINKYTMKETRPGICIIEAELDPSEPIPLKEAWLEINNVNQIVYDFIKDFVDSANLGIEYRKSKKEY